ncbi:MAG: hypothetical protein NZ898_11105 [Myxococcota bacterium]|nr:hypothetical protein [Myxococcota bacterium]MDW8362289.1 hypothetical protein [Myxococcales bacterium]
MGATALVVLGVVLACSTSRQLPDSGWPPDAAGEPNVDVVGRWHDCTSSTTYAPDGSMRWRDHRRGCASSGRWAVVGSWLHVEGQASACGPAYRAVSRVVRTPHALVTVDPETGRARTRWNDATPRALWLLTEADRATVLRVVGEPGDGTGVGCYWSADGACGGLLSCSGWVDRWRREDDRLVASTACGGGCPCGAELVGRFVAPDRIEGTYRGANCEMPYTGTFTAILQPDPMD